MDYELVVPQRFDKVAVQSVENVGESEFVLTIELEATQDVLVGVLLSQVENLLENDQEIEFQHCISQELESLELEALDHKGVFQQLLHAILSLSLMLDVIQHQIVFIDQNLLEVCPYQLRVLYHLLFQPIQHLLFDFEVQIEKAFFFPQRLDARKQLHMILFLDDLKELTHMFQLVLVEEDGCQKGFEDICQGLLGEVAHRVVHLNVFVELRIAGEEGRLVDVLAQLLVEDSLDQIHFLGDVLEVFVGGDHPLGTAHLSWILVLVG